MVPGSGLDTVLSKAAAILRAFGADDQAVPLAELVRRTKLHKTTAHRLCTELVEIGFLDKTTAGYRLAGGLFELGMRASVERSLIELAIPFLHDLAERTHETAHLGVREGREVVYVAKIGGHRQARSPSRVGGRMPLHCTAIGKVLLAYADDDVRLAVLDGPLDRRTPYTVVAPGLLQRQLEAIVANGYANEFEESQIGLACVAAPVFGASEQPIAAMSLTGPTPRFRPESHAAAIRSAASALSAIVARQGLP